MIRWDTHTHCSRYILDTNTSTLCYTERTSIVFPYFLFPKINLLISFCVSHFYNISYFTYFRYATRPPGAVGGYHESNVKANGCTKDKKLHYIILF